MEGKEGGHLLRSRCFHRTCSPSSTSEFRLTAVHQPTCHANHLPPYLEKYEEFKAKGVDVIAVVAANDPYVMSGWGRVEDLEDKVRRPCDPRPPSPVIHSLRSLQILALSDTYAAWSKTLGLHLDLTDKELGVRTGRFAIVVDDLTIKYIKVRSNLISGGSFRLMRCRRFFFFACQAEPGPGVTVSGADAVLAAL